MKTAFMQSNNNPIFARHSKRILNKFNDIILYALTIRVEILFNVFLFLSIFATDRAQSLLFFSIIAAGIVVLDDDTHECNGEY